MKKNNDHIITDQILIEYLKGNISEKNKKEIDQWRKNSAENELHFVDIQSIWEHSNAISKIANMDISGDWKKVKQRMHFEKTGKINSKSTIINFRFLTRVAATVLILVSIGFAVKQFIFTPDILVMSTLDFKQDIILVDGTQVTLNEFSEITYPEKFKRNSRDVKIKGEAFFEVQKNKDKPFTINIDDKAMVKVLGTSFNINTSTNDTLIQLNVISGKVAFYAKEKKDEGLILLANEQATLMDSEIIKNKLTNKNFLSWKTKTLVFNDDPLPVVINDIAKYYKTDIEINSENIKNLRFTSTFEDESLDEVLEELSLVLNIKFIKEPLKIIIY